MLLSHAQLLPTRAITHSGGAPRQSIAPASSRPPARPDAGGRTPRWASHQFGGNRE